MTLRSKNCWVETNQLVFTKKVPQLLATEIFKSKTRMYQRLFLSLPQNPKIVRSSTKPNKKILSLSRNLNQQLILGHLTAILAEYRELC